MSTEAKHSETKKKVKQICNHTYSGYIHKVLKSIFETDVAFNKKGMSTANDMVCIFFNDVMTQAISLMNQTKQKTISDRDIKFALHLVIRDKELRGEAIAFVDDAVKQYTDTQVQRREQAANQKAGSKLKPIARAHMAGIIFPITRIEFNMMLRGKEAFSRKSATAAVALAASMEFIVRQIITLAGNYVKENKKKRISPRAIALSIQEVDESGCHVHKGLESLFNGVVHSGGVKIHVEEVFEQKKQVRRKSSAKKNK